MTGGFLHFLSANFRGGRLQTIEGKQEIFFCTGPVTGGRGQEMEFSKM